MHSIYLNENYSFKKVFRRLTLWWSISFGLSFLGFEDWVWHFSCMIRSMSFNHSGLIHKKIRIEPISKWSWDDNYMKALSAITGSKYKSVKAASIVRARSCVIENEAEISIPHFHLQPHLCSLSQSLPSHDSRRSFIMQLKEEKRKMHL